MIAPLLLTKLLVPTSREDVITRHRLNDLLQQSLSCKLTVVSAPAGFGKTTLIGDWVRLNNVSTAWLSLDENDRDPARFIRYCLRSLQAICPGIGDTVLDILQSPQAQVNEPLLAALINEIAFTILTDFVLVLDDYHVAASPRINEIIAFILTQLPPQMHLVLATRADPSLPVALLRGRGELLEIRQMDLRFTNQDAAEFLNRIKGLRLAPEQISALTNRTEGWISGLQMAAVSMQGGDNIPQFIRSFTGSHRYIFDYLIEEVLNHQLEEVQDFLLRTSILYRLTGDLCNAILDQTDSQLILEYLERSNLFIIPLDDERYWFRYHQLFADLLQKQLVQNQPELLHGLHRKASAWFDKEGFSEAAIAHALASEDYAYAAQTIEENIPLMLGQGENISLIAEFFKKLPDEYIRHRPILSILQIWSLTLSGRLGEAEKQFLDFEGQPGVDENQEIAGQLSLIRALIANIRGEMESAVALAQQADELLPEADAVGRGMVLYILGNGYLEIGNLDGAEQASEKIKQIGIATNNLWTTTVAVHRLAQIKKLRGRLLEARILCEELLQSAALRNAEHYGFLCGICFELGDVLRESNDLDLSREMVVKGLELSESWGIPTDIVTGYITLARICMARADPEGAADAIRKAQQASEKGTIFRTIQAKLDACQVQVWLQDGNLDDASAWAEKVGAELDDLDPEKDFDFFKEMELIAVARAWIAVGISSQKSAFLQKSKSLLSRLARSARGSQRSYRLIEIRALQGVLFDHLGDEDKAMEVLEESLLLAQTAGCMRLFLDEGQNMKSLLHRVRKKSAGLPYAMTLLAAFEIQASDVPAPSARELADPLSTREMEVLRLLPTKMTAAEIAEKLYVAKSTIDTHVKNIYSKLGVNRRMAAVQRAKELELF